MSAVGACAIAGDRVQLQDFLRARCETADSARDCRILNLSHRRAFVESFVPVVTGSTVKLRFRLPNGHQVCATGLVSDHRFQKGFDVDFLDLSPNDREQIAGFVA